MLSQGVLDSARPMLSGGEPMLSWSLRAPVPEGDLAAPPEWLAGPPRGGSDLRQIPLGRGQQVRPLARPLGRQFGRLDLGGGQDYSKLFAAVSADQIALANGFLQQAGCPVYETMSFQLRSG